MELRDILGGRNEGNQFLLLRRSLIPESSPCSLISELSFACGIFELQIQIHPQCARASTVTEGKAARWHDEDDSQSTAL